MTTKQLETKSVTDLVKIYNKATGKSIKKFATKAKGVQATFKALSNSTAPKAPKKEPDCKACSDTGKNSRGGVCKACGGAKAGGYQKTAQKDADKGKTKKAAAAAKKAAPTKKSAPEKKEAAPERTYGKFAIKEAAFHKVATECPQREGSRGAEEWALLRSGMKYEKALDAGILNKSIRFWLQKGWVEAKIDGKPVKFTKQPAA